MKHYCLQLRDFSYAKRLFLFTICIFHHYLFSVLLFHGRAGRCQNHILILAELGCVRVINWYDMLAHLNLNAKLGFDW